MGVLNPNFEARKSKRQVPEDEPSPPQKGVAREGRRVSFIRIKAK
jgi:hypothetical protein